MSVVGTNLLLVEVSSNCSEDSTTIEEEYSLHRVPLCPCDAGDVYRSPLDIDEGGHCFTNYHSRENFTVSSVSRLCCKALVVCSFMRS